MFAEFSVKFEGTTKKRTSKAMESHLDLNTITFQGIDLDNIGNFILLPSFVEDFKKYVNVLIRDRNANYQTKLRFLYYLLCVASFSSRTRSIFISSLRYIFNLVLYVKSFEKLNSEKIKNVFPFSECEFFRQNTDSLSKAILMLLDE
jgi:hypothetical protein